MSAKERVTAFATLRRKKGEGFPRAEVPGPVRRALAGRDGDRLVFEEGCDAAVQRAALKGKYFVVRLERGGALPAVPHPAVMPSSITTEAAPAPTAPLEPVAASSSLETLEEMVKRKLNGSRVRPHQTERR